jgi:4'-phosphopantetheinyl transferase
MTVSDDGGASDAPVPAAFSWQSWPATGTGLDRTAVHIVRVSLAEERDDPVMANADLSPDEIARAARYVVHPPRRRFRLCRRALRRCLGTLTSVLPSAIRFTTEKFGKPILSDPVGTGLVFNVSHTADDAVIAFAWDREIGVDIEAHEPRRNVHGLAERFFSSREHADLLRLPASEQPAGFYRLWTSKEAYLKALGLGLSLPLGAFSMQVDPTTRPAVLDEIHPTTRWWGAAFQVHAHIPGAVLWNGSDTTVHYWNAPTEW